jgi:hypothetical protein
MLDASEEATAQIIGGILATVSNLKVTIRQITGITTNTAVNNLVTTIRIAISLTVTPDTAQPTGAVVLDMAGAQGAVKEEQIVGRGSGPTRGRGRMTSTRVTRRVQEQQTR